MYLFPAPHSSHNWCSDGPTTWAYPMMLKFKTSWKLLGKRCSFLMRLTAPIGHKLGVIRDHLATVRGDPTLRMKPEPRKTNNTSRGNTDSWWLHLKTWIQLCLSQLELDSHHIQLKLQLKLRSQCPALIWHDLLLFFLTAFTYQFFLISKSHV